MTPPLRVLSHGSTHSQGDRISGRPDDYMPIWSKYSRDSAASVVVYDERSGMRDRFHWAHLLSFVTGVRIASSERTCLESYSRDICAVSRGIGFCGFLRAQPKEN